MFLNAVGFENSFVHAFPWAADYMYEFSLKHWHRWAPCYNASADGWEPEVFHAKCDHKPLTVVLARANSWWIFGGISSSPWNARENN